MYEIENIRNFSVDGMALEDLVALSASARVIQEEFTTLKVETPEWLSEKAKEIRREVFVRQADRRAKTLRELKARYETLKPAELKRQEIAEQIAALEAAEVSV